MTKSKVPWYKRRKFITAIVTLAVALIASHLIPPVATVLIPLEINAAHDIITSIGDSDGQPAGSVSQEISPEPSTSSGEPTDLPRTGESGLSEVPSGLQP